MRWIVSLTFLVVFLLQNNVLASSQHNQREEPVENEILTTTLATNITDQTLNDLDSVAQAIHPIIYLLDHLSPQALKTVTFVSFFLSYLLALHVLFVLDNCQCSTW